MNALHPTPPILSRQELLKENQALWLTLQERNRLILQLRGRIATLERRLTVTTQRTAVVQVSAIYYHKREASSGIIGDGPS